MGRIKSIAVKTLGDDLIKNYPKKFSDDFERNKQALDEIKKIKSKRVRNILAGYIVTEMQKIKRSGI